MRKDEWLKLFETTRETDEKTGKPRTVSRYIGPWYTLEAAKKNKCVLLLWIGLVLAAAAFLTAGLIPTWATLCVYVTPWYILCLLPLFYLLMGVVKITRMKEKITQVDVAEGLAYARNAALGLAVLGGAWVIADGIFLCTGKYAMTMTYELIFLACGAATALLGLMMHLAVKKLEPTPFDGNEKEAA